MNLKKLAGILFILLFTAGCQQATLNSAKPFYPDTTGSITTRSAVQERATTDGFSTHLAVQESWKPTEKPETRRKLLPLDPDNDPTSKGTTDVSPSRNSSSSDPNTSDPSDKNASRLPGQDKIDQALELCNYAQKMWEEGDLDAALNKLDAAYFLILDIDSNPGLDQQKEDVRYLISKRILEIYASRQIVVTGQHDAIPVTINSHVQTEIDLLTGPERNFFIRSMERSSRYRPFIVEELKKAGLPEELSWLPLIESGFKLRALSTARALGLWQFIPSTGYKFGLNRNYFIDERMDPEKATLAAIAYLKELHQLFGDWTTALAGYNCGEHRVLKIIQGQKINYLDNFWDLYEKLPQETARYVPRFLATLHIVNNLEKYSMEIPDPQAPIEHEIVEITKQVRLKDIAREIAVSGETLKQLNPELRYAMLPPETYQLKIPKGKAPALLSSLDKIEINNPPPDQIAETAVDHRVKKGETLSGIADKYKMSLKELCRANKISKTHRIVVGQVLKVGTRQGEPEQRVAINQAKAKAKSEKPVSYKVRPGDNLWNIATRFSTTTKQIMAANKLPDTKLYIGQTLSMASSKGTSSPKQQPFYKVKSGDCPVAIAKQHNMSLNRLLALNQLDKSSKIFPGQKLIVD